MALSKLWVTDYRFDLRLGFKLIARFWNLTLDLKVVTGDNLRLESSDWRLDLRHESSDWRLDLTHENSGWRHAMKDFNAVVCNGNLLILWTSMKKLMLLVGQYAKCLWLRILCHFSTWEVDVPSCSKNMPITHISGQFINSFLC